LSKAADHPISMKIGLSWPFISICWWTSRYALNM